MHLVKLALGFLYSRDHFIDNKFLQDRFDSFNAIEQ